jgi:hypothetical protein
MNAKKEPSQRLTSRVKQAIKIGLLMLAASSTLAADLNITARFSPDSNNPNKNEFINTTPVSGFCLLFPAYCTGRFSITIPHLIPYSPLVAEVGVQLRVPYDWQNLEVRHTDGSTQTVKVRIVGMGTTYELTKSVISITGSSDHSSLWHKGSWVYAPSGCGGTGLGHLSAVWYRSFWTFQSAAACVKIPRFSDNPGIAFKEINIMYELQTPNPLEMSAGIYTGSHTYTIGPNGDFQIGAGQPDDPILRLNFSLSVQHTLLVKFPVNSNLLALQPEGGWLQWLLHGSNRLPNKLLANQTYQQWSSSRFKMQLQCQYLIGENCGLQNIAGDRQVPVKTMVTLPQGLRDTSNKVVSRYLLSNSVPSIFQPSRYVDNERSTLHFEVDKAGVEQMATRPGDRYRGDVTIIWDSQI